MTTKTNAERAKEIATYFERKAERGLSPGSPFAPNIQSAARILRALADENDELRATVKRLNRRCQIAESGVAEAEKASGGSLGRSLANASASRLKEENDALRREREELLHTAKVVYDDAVRELRREQDAGNKQKVRDMNEDLIWALTGKHALMEREDDVWLPLLEAAKAAARHYSGGTILYNKLIDAIAKAEEGAGNG